MPVKNSTHKYGGAHGIALYIRENLFERVVFYGPDETSSEFVLWCKVENLRDELSFFLGVVYAPHEASKYHCKDFYDTITWDIAHFKGISDSPFLLLGDFNARTSNLTDFVEIHENLSDLCDWDPHTIQVFKNSSISEQRFSKDKTLNQNGKNLLEFCKISDLKILNGRVGSDANVGNYTCHTGMGSSLIDYGLASASIFPYIQDFTIEQFDRCTSDAHSAISVKIAIDCDTNEPVLIDETNSNISQAQEIIQFDLQWDDERKADFIQNFSETNIQEFENILNSVEINSVSSATIDSITESFKALFIESSKATGLYKKKSYRTSNFSKANKIIDSKPWFDDACKAARSEYLKLKNKMHRSLSNHIRDEAYIRGRYFKNLIKRKKREYNEQLKNNLRDDFTKCPKDFWRFINGNSEDGNNAIDLNTFADHFKAVGDLNTHIEDELDGSEEMVNIENGNDNIDFPFTVDEVRRHIKLLRNNKSAGYDRITNEYLKNCPDIMILLLTKYFNIILESGIVPDDWCRALIQPIYKKKGSKLDPDNYRGISLISCIGKLFTSCVNTRLTDYLEICGLLNDNQAGFRRGYSTIDHIFTLNSILEFYLHHRKKIYAAFIDYRKAFDLIDRTSLWKKVLSYDIKGKIFNVIHNIYSRVKSCVKSGNKLSKFFPIRTGVRQGDVLSPLLFAIYLNDFEAFLSRRCIGLRTLANEVHDVLSDDEISIFLKLYTLLYADDTVILAETEEDLQDALNALEEYCSLWALTVNLDKTKIIIFSRGCIRKHKDFIFAGEKIEVVREYIYLGVTMTYNNTFGSAVEKQLTLAKKAYFSLLSKIEKFNLPLDIQFKLFDRLVIPVLIYGCEVWGYSNLNKIELFHRKFIKNSLRVHKFTANSIIYGESGRESIVNVIHRRMLNYWLRLKQGNPNKICAIMFQLMKKLYNNDILKSKWCIKIREVIDNLGFSYIWDLDGEDINTNLFKRTVKQKMNDISTQNWIANLEGNSLCTNYRLLKTNFCFEEYLYLEDQIRIPITKYRCGSHRLPISNRRFDPLDERNNCPLCQMDIGDEFHYIMMCPALETQRKTYISPYYYERPNVIKFKKLFDEKSRIKLRKLSKFIQNILYIFRPDNT